MTAVAVAQRYCGPADLFSPAIVRDMWLTSVDTPSLCPIYMSKPMRVEAPSARKSIEEEWIQLRRVYGLESVGELWNVQA